MNAGKMLKKGFNTIMSRMGGPILIHKDYETSEQVTSEVKGLKNSKENDPSHVMFQFDKALDISPGDVLQQKGSNTVWHVHDVEDHITSGEFIYFEAHVQKAPVTENIPTPTNNNIIYNVSGPNARVNVNSSDNSVNFSSSSNEIFDELRSLISKNIADDNERETLLAQSKELQAAAGTDNYIGKYQDFMAIASNHITVLTPILPALASLLG